MMIITKGIKNIGAIGWSYLVSINCSRNKFMFGTSSPTKKYPNNDVKNNKKQLIYQQWTNEGIQQSQTESMGLPKQSRPKQWKPKNQLVEKKRKKQTLDQALDKISYAIERVQPQQMRKFSPSQAFHIENQAHHIAMESMKKLSLKDFSIMAHHLVVNYSGQNDTYYRLLWKEIQENYLQRFHQTTCPQQIRSYSKVLYSLAKVKINRKSPSSTITTSYSTNLQNLQTKFALLLPFSTHQSFTMIATSLSRMGPLSEEFSYILQKLYYQKYDSFNVRQKVQINYVLTRNGRKVDKNLYLNMDSMNLNEIVTMLRCYQNCQQLFENNINGKCLLQICETHIIARKKQMNVIDIGEICRLYFRGMNRVGFQYSISPKMEEMMGQMYDVLKRNINHVTFEKIWEFLPQTVNMGFLKISFVEEIISTLSILRKKNMFPDRIWKTLKRSFEEFENQEIRTKLTKIN